MSATVLPTKEQAAQAQAFMIDQIHVPAFLEKLAANGVSPQSKGDVREMLQLGAMLAQAEADGAIKSAEDEVNPFLQHVMRRLRPQQPVSVDLDSMIKANADVFIQNETAKNAALIYGHAVAGGELLDNAS
jgi:hypothetical protein